MFGRIVCNVPPVEFHRIESRVLNTFGVAGIQELDVAGLQALAEGYIKETEAITGVAIPHRSARTFDAFDRSNIPFLELRTCPVVSSPRTHFL